MKCLLVTPRVHSFIQESRPARILHLFDEVINLTNDIGDIISLSTKEIGPGPFSMIMDDDFPGAVEDIKLQDDVQLHPAALSVTIGAHRFETGHAPKWDPHPGWKQLQDGIPLEQRDKNTLLSEINSQLQLLMTAVHTNDFDSGRKAACALAGLGNGLTPAGDDVLMGVLYAFWVWAPDSIWIDLIPDWAAPLTTTLSAAYLRAASCGEATIQWHNLVAGKPNAVDQIISIGHTSGHDAWAGFTATFKSLHRQS